MHWRQLGILLIGPAILAGIAFLCLTPPWEQADGGWQLEPEQAFSLSPIIWVDNRSASEFAAGHMPEAIQVDPNDPEPGLQELYVRWEPDSQIVVYCSASGCDSSRRLAERIREDLVDAQVYWIHGGWDALVGRGQP